MQVKSWRWHPIKLLEATLGVTPETLDAVDVALAGGELVGTMIDSIMFRIADIHQAIIAAPAIGMNDCFRSDATTNNGLQRGLFAVRHDLGVNLAVALQEAEDDGLT